MVQPIAAALEDVVQVVSAVDMVRIGLVAVATTYIRNIVWGIYRLDKPASMRTISKHTRHLPQLSIVYLSLNMVHFRSVVIHSSKLISRIRVSLYFFAGV